MLWQADCSQMRCFYDRCTIRSMRMSCRSCSALRHQLDDCSCQLVIFFYASYRGDGTFLTCREQSVSCNNACSLANVVINSIIARQGFPSGLDVSVGNMNDKTSDKK